MQVTSASPAAIISLAIVIQKLIDPLKLLYMYQLLYKSITHHHPENEALSFFSNSDLDI